MAGSSGNRVNASSPIVSQIPAWIDLLDLHRLDPGRYPFLLESAASGEPLGRYDILFAFPGPTLLLDAEYRLSGPGAGKSARFLDTLDRWWLLNDRSIHNRTPAIGVKLLEVQQIGLD